MKMDAVKSFFQKNEKLYKTIFLVVFVILLFMGISFYFASYFRGLIYIFLSIVVIYFYKIIFDKNVEPKKLILNALKSVSIPLIGIVSAVILGAIIMVITKYNPITAYKALFYGGFYKNWHISVLNAIPLIFTGLSIAFAFQAGLFNIGAEGQYYVGAMVAATLGIYFNLPPLLSILLIFIIAGVLAALYNFIPAYLKVKTGAHEVITTMMFAHIARISSPMVIRMIGGEHNIHAYTPKSDEILAGNWLPRFNEISLFGSKIFQHTNYRVHIGILIAIIVAVLVYYILYNTKLGFEIRAVGHNKNAARTQGISVKKTIIIALMVAGLLAGLSGVNQVLGLEHKMYENLEANYGWNGISVALLASNNPIGVIFTSLLWGALDAGGQYMTRTTRIPNSIVEIIKGIMLFLIVARYIYAYIGNRIKNKRKKEIQNKEAQAESA